MKVWPRHYLQCGSLGGLVGDRGLLEGVDSRAGFRRRWLLGIGDRGGGPSPVQAPSRVEGVSDTLGCGRLAALIFGAVAGPCVVDFARVLRVDQVLCFGGAQLYGDHLPTFLVPPELDGLPHLRWVAGSQWTRFLNPWRSPVTQY